MADEATKEEKEQEEKERLAQEKLDEGEGFIPLPDEADEVEEAIVEELSEEEQAAAKEAGDKEKAAGPEEAPAFKLEGPVQATVPAKEGEPEAIEIIHRGQVHRLTKEKIVELAQKGFDYDFKVGPHGKLVQMVESDPEIAQLIQAHWEKKTQKSETKPAAIDISALSIKPMDDYDSEAEWLKDNLQPLAAAITAIQQTPSPSPAPAAEAKPQQSPMANMLMGRDPANFNFVISKMPEHFLRLSVADYQRVDSDPAALCQFYDFVKEQELNKLKLTPAGNDPPQPRNKPPFKVQSGGGASPQGANDADYAWNLSNEEFDKQLAKAKGHY